MEKFKKVFIVVLVLFGINSYSYSQARMGSSVADLQEEFKGDPSLVSGFPTNSWLSVEMPTAVVFYIFNSKGTCAETIISPTTTVDLNYYLNRYDTEYKKTSEGNWVIVEECYNIYITLKITEDGVYFFSWTF